MLNRRSTRRLRHVVAGSAVVALLAVPGPRAEASCGCASMTIEADRSGDGFSNGQQRGRST